MKLRSATAMIPFLILPACALWAADPAPSLSITPAQAKVPVLSSQQFKVHASGLANPRVEWLVCNGRGEKNPYGGTISQAGLYTAGTTTGKYFYIHARSLANPDIKAIARVEVVLDGGHEESNKQASGGKPKPGPEDRDSWVELKKAHYRLHFVEGNRADAENLAPMLSEAFVRLTQEFAKHEPKRLLESIDFDVYIHPAPTQYANQGRMTVRSQRQSDRLVARLDLLAPSAHVPLESDGWHAYHDARYFRKNIIHEVSTLYLSQLAAGKTNGWSFSEAPSWYRQGIEEYLGVALLPEEDREAYWKRYDAHAARPDSVRVDLVVDDVYGDGAVLLRFLHEKFGRDAVHRILVSEERTFWGAVKAETGLTPEKLVAGMRSWMNGG